MVKNMDVIFKPVKIEFGQVHIAGGYMAKAQPVVSKSIEGSDRRQHIFVKMASSEYWLITATCGGKRDGSRVGFARTSLLCTLREHILRLSDGTDALDNKAVVDIDDYDPMDEINRAIEQQGGHKLVADKQGRTRYYANKARNCIATVNVPSRPHEIDPNCTQMRAVKLFIADRKTVWLSLDDVAWAVRYLFDQYRLKGVPVVDDDDAGPSGAVAGGVP